MTDVKLDDLIIAAIREGTKSLGRGMSIEEIHQRIATSEHQTTKRKVFDACTRLTDYPEGLVEFDTVALRYTAPDLVELSEELGIDDFLKTLK